MTARFSLKLDILHSSGKARVIDGASSQFGLTAEASRFNTVGGALSRSHLLIVSHGNGAGAGFRTDGGFGPSFSRLPTEGL